MKRISVIFGSLDGLSDALNVIRLSGPLVPFSHAETVLAGAETFISADRQVMLIRQYDVQADMFVWRVAAQHALPPSPEPRPLGTEPIAEGPLAHGSASGDSVSPKAPMPSDAGSGTVDA